MAKPPSGSAEEKAEKEARLAAALRANLRRRKVAKRASAPEKQGDPDKA